MPNQTRVMPPQYKIFEPDAVDATYAAGTLKPDMGGYAYALGLAHRGEASRNQEAYLSQADKYNKMAFALDQLEQQQKGDLALQLIHAKGEDPAGELKQGVLNATIAKMKAQAANTGAGSGPKSSVTATGVVNGQTIAMTNSQRSGMPAIPVIPGANRNDTSNY